jgi:hypothetical protein
MIVTDEGGGVPSSITTRPETYMGRVNVGCVVVLRSVVGVLLTEGRVVVEGDVVFPAGAPAAGPPGLAWPNKEQPQKVVRRRMRAELRIRNLQ